MTKSCFWDEPFLYKQCDDQLLRRCVDQPEARKILYTSHEAPYGGHFGRTKTSPKVFQLGYIRPSLFKDAYEVVKRYDRCQRV